MAHSAALGLARRLGGSTRLRAQPQRRLLLRVRTRLERPWLDGRIARGVTRPGDRALGLRQAQLVDRRERRRLARRFERVLVERPRPSGPSSAVPLDYGAVGAAKPVLTEIVLSLLSSDAVAARGVALGWRLLTHPCSPLYAPNRRPTGRVDDLTHDATLVLLALSSSARPVRRLAR